MAHQVTLEEAASHLPELVREARNGSEVVLLQDRLPVARLVPLEAEDVSAADIAKLVMVGGAFDWLADEPDLYDDASGEPVALISALLRQWQQEYGLPPRPDGKAHTSVQELFAVWDSEDLRLTPE